jgi:Carboxypeptidase regulatory-like domain
MTPRPAVVVALVLLAGGAGASVAATSGFPFGGVEGRVSGASAVLPGARVWAYQLADLSLLRATANDRGQFNFANLPAGLYRLVAHQPGFLPVVVLVTRVSAEARQFVDLQLAPAPSGTEPGDFWSLREQIPSDVLREMEAGGSTVASAQPHQAKSAAFQTEFAALTGLDKSASEAHLSRGTVGVAGEFGGMRVGVLGDFWALDSNSFANSDRTLSQGSANSLSVRLENRQDLVHVTSSSNRLAVDKERDDAVEVEQYRVSWSRPVGERGRSSVAAQYTSELNFYRWGLVSSAVLPDASRTLRVDGSYVTTLGRSTVETGLRYQQRQGDFITRRAGLLDTVPEETVSLYGRGSFEASPSVVLEYGLYTRLRDGAVSLTPRGGLVVQLGRRWQAAVSAAHRLDPERAAGRVVDFTPVYYGDRDGSELAEDYRYGLTVSRSLGEQGSVSLGAIDRLYGENMRLYFSEQFFDHLENLYLVPGDRLPELQFSISQQLTPKIHSRLNSSYAEGGGGVVQATTKSGAYENDIRYMVTSLDTHFEPTSTGVFLAVHRVEQQLNPLRGIRSNRSRTTPRPVQIESLELAFTQDLNVLLNLASDWAVQLQVELSRGEVPDAPFASDELRRRILGGIAVQF